MVEITQLDITVHRHNELMNKKWLISTDLLSPCHRLKYQQIGKDAKESECLEMQSKVLQQERKIKIKRLGIMKMKVTSAAGKRFCGRRYGTCSSSAANRKDGELELQCSRIAIL